MEWIAHPEFWASLVTLTALEIVLGVDNVIFISIVATRLPEKQRAKARRLGLTGALVLRVAMLTMLVWMVGLTQPVFDLFGWDASWRDLILLGGGLFLLYKGTVEIHQAIEGSEHERKVKTVSFTSAIIQIMILDMVFSLDSVITAIGMTTYLPAMISAVVIAIIVMMVAAGALGRFIEEHPTTKMLALAFLLAVGVALVADGFHFHFPRGYLYFGIAFSGAVEALNVIAAGRQNRKKKGQLPES
jgi:predicted tellurium resistance membrane protein TerC